MIPTEPDAPRRRHRPPSLVLRLMRVFGVFTVLAASVLIGGFFLFIASMPKVEARGSVTGDGIVVLTGGPERLSSALQLLADGRARRLLISGVHPDTTQAQLTRLHPEFSRLLDCCTDLGRRALNTAGNAVETRQWVRKNGFETVILVTSGWHMPRSLLELQRAIPEVIFVPSPVISGDAGDEAWWREPHNLRLLVAEYVKYLAAVIEVRLAPRVTDEDPAEKSAS